MSNRYIITYYIGSGLDKKIHSRRVKEFISDEETKEWVRRERMRFQRVFRKNFPDVTLERVLNTQYINL